MVAGAVSLRRGVEPSVLIVDDDDNAREFMTDVLRFEGFQVATLADPTLAIQRIRDEEFHLLVIDLMMPKLDGIELLAQLRAFDSSTPVITITGHPWRDTADAATELGISAYLQHPINLGELRAALASIASKPGFGPHHERELYLAIARRIRSGRKAHGLSRLELARRAHVPIALVTDIERATASAPLIGLWRISRVLHLKLNQLFSGY